MKHVVTCVALMLWCSPGCVAKPGPERSSGTPPVLHQSVHPDVLGFRYPVARWRLATREALEHATLWVGHIAIRHESSQTVPFRPPGWQPDPPNPKRGVAEALALAERLQAQAALTPEKFEDLARKYSEDVVTRDQGGMLGGVRASQLTNTDFLDALAVLKAGEISRPFRTPYGFHIIKRYAPPSEEQVSGERIVIGYQGVYGLADESHRTREQALQLAREVAAQAKRRAHTFGDLVDRYSDNTDRTSHGDLGVYSTRDPGYFPAEIYLLAGLKVGEVIGPVDSRFGFEILQRVPVSFRKEYAMTAIELRADAMTGDRDAKMAQTLTLAEGVLRQLRVAPDQFRDIQRNFCCDRVQRWTRGRGSDDLNDVLDRLSFGEIAQKPIIRPTGYMLVKRLDPRKLTESRRQFDVPNPGEPDYDDIALNLEGEQLVTAIPAFMKALRKDSVLDSRAVMAVADALDKVAAYLKHNEVDHVTIRSTLQTALASLEPALGPEQFSRFNLFSRQWVIRQMMPPGSVD